MATTFRSLLAVTALLAGIGTQGAFAQEMFPRTVGSGESAEIVYGPGPHGNILGGGAVTVQQVTGDETIVTYLDAQFVQQAQPGTVPSVLSVGENSQRVDLPAASTRG
ncbi:hypothetical protein HB662_21835 [Roseomonas frigidaquae]|uniref:Uncharacterized protein n=1 Tax=Falsiroseomonas frigidaquae TaxID=487318 RepID=A0ABX1F5A7_9PROT|nr:hypothetical protein [Falsiroseomonas frigidaquae]NKE47434.1 hypothetical protein [Falsiroseomonas frigidaquae]